MTRDLRIDSPSPDTPTREMGQSSDMREVLRHLGKIGEDISDMRQSQKSMAQDISGLKGSHDQHGKTLAHLGSQFVELKSEVSSLKSEVATVRTIAERADAGQNGAHRKISETQHELTGTLAAVQVSQNNVAGRAEKVAEETSKQTLTLATITSATAKTETAVDKINRNMPLVNATAIAVATAVGYAVNAYFSVHH